jgi:hypothetical protein
MAAENLKVPTEDQWIEKYRAAIAVMPVQRSRIDQLRSTFDQARSAVFSHFEKLSSKVVDRILDQWTRARTSKNANLVHPMAVCSLPAAAHLMPSSVAEELAQRKTG